MLRPCVGCPEGRGKFGLDAGYANNVTGFVFDHMVDDTFDVVEGAVHVKVEHAEMISEVVIFELRSH